MDLKNPIRRLLAGAALFALLFFASSVGEALHHHDSASPDTHCQICHVSHQFSERAAQAHGASAPVLLGAVAMPPALFFFDCQRAQLIPTRAPPAA